MSRKMKITIIATVIIIIFTVLCSFNSVVNGEINEAEVTMKTLYSLDQKELNIPEEQVETYVRLGWYKEPVMKIYSLDKREMVIYKYQFEEYHKMGWYSEPVFKLFNPAGGYEIVAKSQLEEYKQRGFKEPLPVNENDVILLARVIHAEATQQPNLRVMDRQYVGAVIMNRVKHPQFPNTLQGVIYARNQYACVGNYLFNQYPPQECLDIARQLLEGETFGVPSNVVFQAQFHQGKGLWKQVGVHYYCYI